MSAVLLHRPPNFEQIRAVFPKAEDKGVLFAYDGKIYNPSALEIPWALVEHENVHLRRQQELGPRDHSTTRWSGADVWWDNYLRDPEFRYHEELLAHAAEYKALAIGDRNFLAGLMLRTAARLVAPLYNYQPPRSLRQAMADLRREVEK